jgi:hypothetical protein
MAYQKSVFIKSSNALNDKEPGQSGFFYRAAIFLSFTDLMNPSSTCNIWLLPRYQFFKSRSIKKMY